MGRRGRRRRPDGRGPGRGPLRLPPRLPGQPARGGLRLRGVGATPRERAPRRRRTATWRPRPAGTAGSPCSTGSSTPTTTTPTSTRATGRWSSSSSPPTTRRRPWTRPRSPSATPSTRASRSPQWDDPKLEIVDGTHPVVHPAAGSHANFYEDALYLGTSAEQGFGCDDARNPADDLSPTIAVVPSDPAAARPSTRGSGSRAAGASARRRSTTGRPARTPRRAGPTRSATRSRTAATSATPCLPAALFGTSATDFFCSTVLERLRGRPQARRQPRAPARSSWRCCVLLVVWRAPPHHLDARSLPCASPGAGPPGS